MDIRYITLYTYPRAEELVFAQVKSNGNNWGAVKTSLLGIAATSVALNVSYYLLIPKTGAVIPGVSHAYHVKPCGKECGKEQDNLLPRGLPVLLMLLVLLVLLVQRGCIAWFRHSTTVHAVVPWCFSVGSFSLPWMRGGGRHLHEVGVVDVVTPNTNAMVPVLWLV